MAAGLTPAEVETRLRDLFARAKAADEFEYACTLLRVRGLESPGWDPFVETQGLVNDLRGLISAPLQGPTQVRLGLLLYSHLTELDTLYAMVANLARVIGGDRYLMEPFQDLYRESKRRNRRIPPSAQLVVAQLGDELREAGEQEIAEILDWHFDSDVRNAFSHADYVLYEDSIRSREAWFLVNGVRQRELPVQQFLELLNQALAVFGIFLATLQDALAAYTEDKVVEGRFAADGSYVPIELLADAERGLYGFQAPPGADTGEGRAET